MPIARCLCGAEILVIPDLKAMDQAIKNHVAEHEKARNSSEGILALDLLEQYLVEQVLIVASKNEKHQKQIIRHRSRLALNKNSSELLSPIIISYLY